jgi:hypothetical protein
MFDDSANLMACEGVQLASLALSHPDMKEADDAHELELDCIAEPVPFVRPHALSVQPSMGQALARRKSFSTFLSS